MQERKKIFFLIFYLIFIFKSARMLFIGDGVVAQLVRASACHAEGRGFEPLQSRHLISPSGEFFLLKGLSPKGSRQFQQQFIRHCRLNSLCFIGWCIIIGHRTIIIWHTQSRHLISPSGEFFLLPTNEL